MDPRPHHRLMLVIGDITVLGGMEVQLIHLANGLAAAGHRVQLVSVRSEPGTDRPTSVPLYPAVERVDLGATERLDPLRALGRLTRLAREADVVHCTGWDASLYGRLAGIAARRPVVVAEHSPGREHEVSRAGRPRGQWIARHNRVLDPFTCVTVVCADWQRTMTRSEGVADARTTHIPNGVPVAELRRRAAAGGGRTALGLPEDAKVLALAARFVPQKRHVLAMDVVERVRAQVGDVRLVLAGDGPERPRIEALARERDAGWVSFLGRHGDMAAVFAAADASILISEGEALPMSVLESIAVTVPLVATDVGDVGPVLRHTGAGLVVAPGDVDGLVDACRRVLTDEPLHGRLVAAADAAAAEIDAATMVARYGALFDWVRSSPRRRPAAHDFAGVLAPWPIA